MKGHFPLTNALLYTLVFDPAHNSVSYEAIVKSSEFASRCQSSQDSHVLVDRFFINLVANIELVVLVCDFYARVAIFFEGVS
jgi:hypothetical protein